MGFFSKLFNTSNNSEPLINDQQPRARELFKMIVEDHFYISLENRGTVAKGTIESGRVNVGDTIILVSGDTSYTTTVKGIEFYQGVKDAACKGDNVGLLISGIDEGVIQKGDILQSKS